VKAIDLMNPASFLRELKAYTTLQHLQGRLIPIHYRIAEIKHTRSREIHKAYLLELVNRLPLSECTEEQLRDLCTKEKIAKVYILLRKSGLI
jgi:hypothetical protein